MPQSLAEHLYYVMHADALATTPQFAALPPDQRSRWERAAYRLNPETAPSDFDVPGLGRVPLRTMPAADIAEVGTILSAVAKLGATHMDDAARERLDAMIGRAFQLLSAGAHWAPSEVRWPLEDDAEQFIPIAND